MCVCVCVFVCMYFLDSQSNYLCHKLKITCLSLGILQDTAGRDNGNPWASKNLRKTETFIDYYTIVFQTTTSNYSVSHGLEVTPLPAICRYGNFWNISF